MSLRITTLEEIGVLLFNMNSQTEEFVTLLDNMREDIMELSIFRAFAPFGTLSAFKRLSDFLDLKRSILSRVKEHIPKLSSMLTKMKLGNQELSVYLLGTHPPTRWELDQISEQSRTLLTEVDLWQTWLSIHSEYISDMTEPYGAICPSGQSIDESDHSPTTIGVKRARESPERPGRSVKEKKSTQSR